MATSTSGRNGWHAGARARRARTATSGRTRGQHLPDGLLREASVVAFAMLLYFLVRNLTAGAAATAQANALDLHALERALGIDWEGSLQGLVARNDALVTLTNWVYIWGHWPLILTTAVALYVLRPGHYRVLRDAMFVSGTIGFVFFAFLPVAPPRLVGLGLVDTVTERSHAYRALQPPGLTNQFAAFPSLHVGWNVLVGIVLFSATTVVALRALAILSPLAMAFAVVATANHFVLDVAGGLALVLVGLAAALAFERREATATLSGNGHLDDRGPAGRGTVRRRPSRRQSPR